MIFERILAPTWPPSWHQIAQLWQHLECIFALLQPSLVNMAPGRLPDLPKHPPDLNFLRFSTIFGMIFDTFLNTLFQNVIDNFSGNSAMQPVSETSRFKLFSTFLQLEILFQANLRRLLRTSHLRRLLRIITSLQHHDWRITWASIGIPEEI